MDIYKNKMLIVLKRIHLFSTNRPVPVRRDDQATTETKLSKVLPIKARPLNSMNRQSTAAK